jgi:glycine cleavage system H protein
MTFLLVIMTVAIILAIELVRNSHRTQSHASPELVTEYPTSFEVLERYFHPGHTWAMVSGSRNVVVGIDDFSSSIMGTVDRIDLPKVGQAVRQGEALTLLCHGARRLAHVAPISGKIVDVNKKLENQPGLLNESPFERGWIARIAPANFDIELRNLFKGIAADGWRNAIRSQFTQFFSPNIGIAIQDGGQIVQNLGDHLRDDEWSLLVQQFFPTVSPNHYFTNQ